MADTIDDAFLARVYRTTGLVTAIMVLASMSVYGWRTTVNLVVGVAVGLLFLAVIAHSTRPIVQPEAERRRAFRAASILYVGKFAVAGGVMYLLARLDYIDGAALAVGYSLPTAIMVLKLLGQELVRRLDEPQKT